MRIASSLLFVTALASAQPRMSAPLTGYVFDGNSRSIRAVVGVPGAASAGDRVVLAESLSLAFLHPSLPLAAGVGKDGGVVVASWKDAGHPQQVSIATGFGSPERIVFASTTDKALFVSGTGVELWSGLEGATAVRVYGFGVEQLGGSPTGAALSKDGTLAAVVLDSSRVVEVSEAGITPVGLGRYAVYAPELYVLNAEGELSQGGTNTVARGFSADTELATMAGFAGVVALDSGSVALVDLVSGQTARVDCGGCKAMRGQALPTQGILYFEDDQRGGLLLDNTTGGSPRIVPVAGIDGRRNQ